jgi:large subunit ribosomal protein L24
MKIHIGDTVVVIAGKDKGKQGSVMRVLPLKNRVVIEGINMRVRHIKKTAQQAGQRIKYEASIHLSNVMILDPKTKKPTRIGYKVDPKTGKKTRVALGSGEVIPIVSKTKAEAKAKKKGAKPETQETPHAKKTEKKDEIAVEKVQGPTKQPFWKRAFHGANPDDQNIGEERDRRAEIDKSTVRRTGDSN